jgi:CspA family cold shock protein
MTVWQLWHGFMAMHGTPRAHPGNICLRNRTDCCPPNERYLRPTVPHASYNSGRGTATLGSVIRHWAPRLVAMANGNVDFFNDTGGYGFISTDDDDVDDDEDVFFHMEDVGGPDLEEGQEVEFDIESSPKGPRATNLVRN